MNKKAIIIAAVALVAVVALMLGIWLINRPTPEPVDKQKPLSTADVKNPQTNEDTENPEEIPYSKTITVTVVHADKTEKIFTYHTNAGYLGEVLYTEGLIKNEGADQGMFNIVDGEKADWNENQSYWALYQGEAYAMYGVDDTPVNDGDTFKLVYTIG